MSLSPVFAKSPSLRASSNGFGSMPFVVYASPGSEYFGRLIAQHLNCEFGTLFRRTFPNGERYYRVDVGDDRTRLAGKTVIYVSATVGDDELLELFRVGCVLASLGTTRRIFVIPYLGYSTMERAVLPGEVVTAKSNARLLSAIPNSGLGNVFLMMDLHVAGLLQYFEGPCQSFELYANQYLISVLDKYVAEWEKDSFVFGSADLGRPKWVESFACHYNVGMAFIRKTRSMENTKVVGKPIGDVAGKRVIIYDDMTRTAGTLIKASDAYLAAGATEVIAVLSHFALCDEKICKAIEESSLSLCISTNTHPMSQLECVKNSKKFAIVDVSPEFTRAIMSFSGIFSM